MYHFTEVLAKRAQKAHVEVHLNTELTPQMVADLHADAVIVAIGAKPIVPNIPGIHSDKVVGLSALESIEPKLGDKVVILGGGLVGSEVAIHLDMLGKDVTVVEMKQDWAMDAYFMHKNTMKIYVRDSDIRFLCNTTAKAVTEQGLLCVDQDGKEMELQADTILLAAGFKVGQSFRDDFYHTADQVIMVGDAIRPARVVDAVSSGYYAALDI